MDKQLIEQTRDLLNQIKQLHGSENIVILSAGNNKFVIDSNDDRALSYAMILSAANDVSDQMQNLMKDVINDECSCARCKAIKNN